MSSALLYLLFFCSGISGLIFQVIWVRVFANVFGNTIYSASLVIAVFMLGLGAGSYAFGAWADRRYLAKPESMLRAYGWCEIAIGALGLSISLLLPHLGELSARFSTYSRDAAGWYVLSASSYAARTAVAIVLLTPVTILMGGTLTLLIRHVVGVDLGRGGTRIAVLYGVNTTGAAVGCFLTDFALVPAVGLQATQAIAAGFNVAAAIGAFWIARGTAQRSMPSARSAERKREDVVGKNGLQAAASGMPAGIAMASLALALSGFAAMGMEIVWFRHFSILLGEFRAVFSLLLAIILLGIGFGSFLAGLLIRPVQRRASRPHKGAPDPSASFDEPAQALILVQGVFVVATLSGLALTNAASINDAAAAYAATHRGAPASSIARALAELWFNARPILVIVGLPALLMGCSFPLANAIVQRATDAVGRRAGLLYLSNTIGAVCGSIVAGFVLLPSLGIQSSAAFLTFAAAFASVPLLLATARAARESRRPRVVAGAAMAASMVAVGTWAMLPSDYVLSKALLFPLQHAYAVSEGVTELVAVTDGPDGGRVLVTNGHPMSSTELLSQRYMRAMAHVPLLASGNPSRVLVICFGVGNTAHAATMHPSVEHVDVVDLSRHILDHSGYFKDVNGGVLHDPRVSVYVNDGRHHLLMEPAGTYDLITLEPPPIVHAGVAALYSEEFYLRARTRLKPGGYLSQWLPAFGVPQSTLLSMVRSFVDVFPNAVLLSGASSNLLLIGTTAPRNDIDPERLTAALAKAPRVRADLQRLDLGSPREIIGMFVASARTLAAATRSSPPVTDDHPLQEYGKRSLLDADEGLPAAIVDLRDVASWCPGCFAHGGLVPSVDGLDTYLSLMNLAYTAPRLGVAQTVPEGTPGRTVAGSGYLGAVIPESPALHSVLDAAFTDRYQDATDLLEQQQYTKAIDGFHAALAMKGDSVEAHNNLGIALASLGRLDEAIDQFKLALTIRPDFEDARRNLATALTKR